MKLLNNQLKNKIWYDVHDEIIEHAPWNSPVRYQIRKNLGLWINDNNLFRLKIHNTKNIIGNDLDETT